jgi:hypothetical protein
MPTTSLNIIFRCPSLQGCFQWPADLWKPHWFQLCIALIGCINAVLVDGMNVLGTVTP